MKKRKFPHLNLIIEFCESFNLTGLTLKEAIDVYTEYHIDLARRKEACVMKK